MKIDLNSSCKAPNLWYNTHMENTIQPSFKAPSIDAMLTSVFGVDRVKTISGGTCVSCDAEDIIASSFDDDLSRKEYSISGMCQSCQNDIFGEEDDEPEGFDDFEPREDFGYFGEAGLWD